VGVVFALVLAGSAVGCSSSPNGRADASGASTGSHIKLMGRPWDAAAIDNAIARILLTEQMGMSVEIVPVTGQDIVTPLANGDVHVDLEAWPDATITEKLAAGEAEDGGELGPIGKIGWYVPSYWVMANPTVATWQGFTDPQVAASIATPQTAGLGRFLSGTTAWGTIHQQIIANLGLPLEVVYAGSEQAELDLVDEAYASHQPILFYLWTPHWALAKYDLTQVKLPAYNDGCYAKAASGGIDCDYPATLLTKVLWPGLKDYSPRAYAFLKAFHYTTKDQVDLLAKMQFEGESADQAARDWIDANPAIWTSWIPSL
jgi:glycine betaine/proline transport system substrate-binding protein